VTQRGFRWVGRPPNLFQALSQHLAGHFFLAAAVLHFNLWTAKKLIEKLRYMHRNPVMRGLVALPERWRWSSFRT
jgi:putative transposase